MCYAWCNGGPGRRVNKYRDSQSVNASPVIAKITEKSTIMTLGQPLTLSKLTYVVT